MSKRSGTIYVVVLMASLIVATMALASIETMRWHARDLYEEEDALLVQIAADAGLEVALGKLNTDLNWRSNHNNNVDSSPIAINGASVKYRLVDADGDLADNDLDPCDMIVTAEAGAARLSWQATLQPDGEPLDCLAHSLVSRNDLTVAPSALVATNTSAACDNVIDVKSGGHMTADCFSTDGYIGQIYGAQNSLPNGITIPDPTFLDYYVEMGTAIDLSSIPRSGNQYQIDGHLLSDKSNTLTGVVDANGVYIIDCNGKGIAITNSRLKCTLVLKNIMKNSYVGESVFWEAAISNFPILLVDGDMEFNLSRAVLEESAIGRNLNPTGTPYRGISDANTTTAYPSQLRGLIYVSYTVELRDPVGENDLTGILITNDSFTSKAALKLTYRDIYTINPPPGFHDGSRLRIVPGSVRRVSPP